MKQRRIKELDILHYEQGSSVYYYPSREEEYAAVLAQAEAHQDLRFHTEINSEEVLIILPWESVIGVYATYETADVAAPTDTICGDVEAVDFQFTLEEPANISIESYMGECSLDSIPIKSFTFYGTTYDWVTADEVMASLPYTVTIGGKTYEFINTEGVTVDCEDFVDGETVSVTVVGHFHGVDSTPFTFDAVVSVSENG